METLTKKVHKHSHRGNIRIWFEGQWLTKFGFKYHAPYSMVKHENSIEVFLDEDGSRKVSGRLRNGKTEHMPILDFSSKEITEWANKFDHIKAHFSEGSILIEGVN